MEKLSASCLFEALQLLLPIPDFSKKTTDFLLLIYKQKEGVNISCIERFKLVMEINYHSTELIQGIIIINNLTNNILRKQNRTISLILQI